MDPAVLVGDAQPELGAAIAHSLGVEPVARTCRRFPDGELEVVVVGAVRHRDLFVVQSTGAPAGEHLMELLLLADAALGAGARSVSAVIPYFGYARQDRREREGEPIGVRVAARLLATVRFRHIVAVDLHSRAIEGYLEPPAEHLTAAPLLAGALRRHLPDRAVVVSPDLGAVKLAERYASALGVPMAVVHKKRLSGAEVAAHAVMGEVRDRVPILVDDMISTGGTIDQATRAVRAAGASPELYLAATHGLLVGEARSLLARLGVNRLVTTDSVRVPAPLSFASETVSLAPLLADAIRRLAHQKGDLAGR
jgi:ribose-phosphate pyrophosphokinase